jgi:hypothetical protein
MPSEPELVALRRGEIYDPSKECQTDDHPDEPGASTGDDFDGKNNCTMTPPQGRKRKQNEQPEYLQKYEKHLGGSLDVGKDTAQSTKTSNRTYGNGKKIDAQHIDY